MAQPRFLPSSRGGTPVVLFARNTLCVIARRSIGLTRSNMLQRLTDPAVRIAMSMPGADPSGDYAERMFDRADVFRPGARAILDDKAMKLGNLSGSKRGSDAPPFRESLFKDGRIDAVIGYCSGAAPLTAHVPDLVAIPVEDALAVTPEYGLVVLSSNVAAARFALFVMSEQRQAIMAHAGLLPVRLPTKLKSPIPLKARSGLALWERPPEALYLICNRMGELLVQLKNRRVKAMTQREINYGATCIKHTPAGLVDEN